MFSADSPHIQQRRGAYSHILATVYDRPWAILPSKLLAITEFLNVRLAGERLAPEAIVANTAVGPEAYAVVASTGTREPLVLPEAARGAARVAARPAGSRIAVLPLFGLILPRVGPMDAMSGATSLEEFMGVLRAVMADEAYRAVVLNVDSPGGSVDLIQESAAEIRGMRGGKPLEAVANTMAASASYWLATAASRVSVTPSGMVGSIGVVAAHQDFSRMDEMAGVTTTLITSAHAPYKAEGAETAPLADEARAEMQRLVDAYEGQFIADVARQRGVSVAAVRSGFGGGRMRLAKEAVAAGMADGVATLDEVLQRLGSTRREGGPAGAAAASDGDEEREAGFAPDPARVAALVGARLAGGSR